jgi:hypothetical protein
MASLRTVFSISLRAFPRTQPTARTTVPLPRPQIVLMTNTFLQLKQARWKAPQQLNRPFSSTIIHLSRPPRSPQTQYPQQSLPPKYYEPPPPPPPPLGSGSSSLVVGSVIAACVCLYAYESAQFTDFKQNGSKKAYLALESFNKHFVLSIKNIREGRYYVLLTHTFAHSNLMHLGFNMLALWGFGRIIVMMYGVRTFAGIWWVNFQSMFSLLFGFASFKRIGCFKEVFLD